MFPSHPGNSVKRSDLARQAVDTLRVSGIEAELHYLQGVSNAEVPVWLNASDVVLLTSFHEGSPTIVKEALACDRPVVSVDVGDVRERIEDVPGCHIAMPDAESLAAKLRIVAAGPGRVNGRVKMQTLSLHAVAGRLHTFYNELLGAPRRGAPSQSSHHASSRPALQPG